MPWLRNSWWKLFQFNATANITRYSISRRKPWNQNPQPQVKMNGQLEPILHLFGRFNAEQLQAGTKDAAG